MCVVVGGSLEWCICMATNSWPVVCPGAVCLQQCCPLVSVVLGAGTLRCIHVWLCRHWSLRPRQCRHASAVLYGASLLWCCRLVLHPGRMSACHPHMSLLLRVKSPLPTTLSIRPQGTLQLHFCVVIVCLLSLVLKCPWGHILSPCPWPLQPSPWPCNTWDLSDLYWYSITLC